MTTPKMTPRKMADTIRLAWFAFERAARGFRELDEALTITEKQEREHRAMGRRVCGAGYKLSVDLTARYFVMRNAYVQHPAPSNWIEAAGWRKDIVLCQSLREKLVDADRYDEAFGSASDDPAFMAIDYADHIAVKP